MTSFSDRIIRLPEVISKTGLSKPTIYKLISQGKFPRPLRIFGTRSSGWSEAAVDRWVENVIARADPGPGFSNPRPRKAASPTQTA